MYTTVNKAHQSPRNVYSVLNMQYHSTNFHPHQMLWILNYGHMAGLVWGQSLIMTQGLPDVRNWGWIVDADHEQSQI